MQQLIGTWQVEGGPFAGLLYQFDAKGKFTMEMPQYGVKAAGTYTVDATQTPAHIDIDFKENSLGPQGLGVVKGIVAVEGTALNMKVGDAGGTRWTDPAGYVKYRKVS